MPDADPVRTAPESTAGRTGRNRLGYLDGIRGLAASYVVVSHAWDTVYANSRPTSGLQLATTWMAPGRYAVTVFIVVSERPFMSRGSRPPAIGQKAVIAAPVSVVPAPRSARRAEAPRRVERTGDATVADQVG